MKKTCSQPTELQKPQRQ